MKKSILYGLLVFLFLGTTAFLILRQNNQTKTGELEFYPMLERKGSMAQTPEWKSTQLHAQDLIHKVRAQEDLKSTLELATLYIQEGRVTGNYSYYNAAAMKYVDDVLEKEPANFEALTLKALLQLSQHHFTDAIATANEASRINPYSAFVYGILVDGQIEMGSYAEAVASADKMISIRPDLRSYSRVGYLREIHGDYAGAIEAMKMAVDAGMPSSEPAGWARIQLARLYEHTGDLKNAEMHYRIALEERPGYAYALAGLANLALAAGNLAKAEAFYEQARAVADDDQFTQKLALVYDQMGEGKRAARLYDELISKMKKSSAETNGGAHHTDKELASVYFQKKEGSKALKYAELEYNRRPENIEVNEMVAWGHYLNGDYEQALPFLQKAMRTGSKDPSLLCHAGCIYMKNGQQAKAEKCFASALQAHPVLDWELEKQSEKMLLELRNGVAIQK
jgi:tetratricopeptide (TPR) repeat protein